MNAQRAMNRVRILLILFVAGLVISGLTAFPLRWEADILKRVLVDDRASLAYLIPGLPEWIALVQRGIENTYRDYPFMAYGTDWLGFAHIVIAVAFLGPLRDPVRNVWVVEFGMIACVLLIPLALIFGPLRGIPFGWSIVDMLFGVVGIVPLWLARRHIARIALEA